MNWQNDITQQQTIQSPLNKTFNDKFYFIMNLPKPLKELGKRVDLSGIQNGPSVESIKWSLISASIPSNDIKSQSLPYAGGNVYISSHTKSPYNPLKITFKVDNKYANYFTVYEWLNFIYDESAGHYDANDIAKGKFGLNAYATNISIVGTDEYYNPVIQWIFTRAFPTNIDGLELNYQKPDEMTVSASFVFSQMKVRSILSTDRGIQVS